MRTTETWIIEQDYNSHRGDYDVRLGAGRAVRYTSYNSFSGSNKSANWSGDKAAQTAKQSVVKVTGHKTSSGGLKAHVDYISRRGGIDVENEMGEIFNGDDRDNGFKEWVVDHEERMKESMIDAHKWKTSRVATSVVFSTPEGSDTESLKAAVREFAQKNFGDRRYIFAVHAPDTEVDPSKITAHPHIHLVVECMSPEADRALRTEPETLREWRRDFGEIAKEHGINIHDLNRSRSKPAPHEKDMNLYQMLKRGEIPEKYKNYYEKAQERVQNNDFGLSPKEQGLIDRAKSEFIGRQRQIDDLGALIKTATLQKDKDEYLRQSTYLKSVNGSIRMPMNNSQMMLKHAYEQDERKEGRGSKYFYAAPTVKHYMFADRLAQSHNVKLPKMAHSSYKDLNKFINDYADRPTPKFKDLIKTVAIDRGLEVTENVFLSHKAAMHWFKINKEVPTIKTFKHVNNIAKKFNVEPPTNLNSQSVKSFLAEYQDKVSPQMQSYAQSIAKRTGRDLNSDLFNNKDELATWINEHKKIKPERQHDINSMVNRAKVNNEPDLPVRDDDKKGPTKEAIKTAQDLMNKGFYVTRDDVSDDEAIAALKRSFTEKQESSKWTRPINAIDPEQPPVKEKERSRGIDHDR